MAEQESAHGKLSQVDREWNGPRFMALLVGTLVVALIIIYSIASYKTMDFSWDPLAHDPGRHVFETSAL